MAHPNILHRNNSRLIKTKSILNGKLLQQLEHFLLYFEPNWSGKRQTAVELQFKRKPVNIFIIILFTDCIHWCYLMQFSCFIWYLEFGCYCYRIWNAFFVPFAFTNLMSFLFVIRLLDKDNESFSVL